MSAAEEKRRSSRYEFSLRVLFRREDAAYFYEARTENISAHGVFIPTNSQRLEIGAQVILMLSGDSFGGNLPLKGRVSWVRHQGMEASGPAGMGIDFEGLSGEQRQRIGDALKKMAEKDEG